MEDYSICMLDTFAQTIMKYASSINSPILSTVPVYGS